MPWLEVSIETDGSAAESLSEFLNEAGALSVTATDAGDEPLLEPAPGETPLWQRVRITALMDAGTDCAALCAELQAACSVPAQDITIETLDDRDWSSTWRESFGAMRFGDRLWVAPAGDAVDAADAVIVRLDPGLAFGTGTHATTALCLEWLDAHPPVNEVVIDYGCGSGILAIAAHKLGAASVVAIDIDPQALQATRDNALRNGIESGLTVSMPEENADVQAGLVIANILANPLVELAGRLTGQLLAGGHIIMTGVMVEQAERVMAAYRDVIEFDAPVVRDEWVLLAGKKQ
ncbi:MAG: 50S ribosomal protein L11 methyltransferase [Gammaproteobacteria bacterium]|nr:50S ribosomal protein L11 methyltransferase [Gammaproteobacteria bacterium]